MTKDHLYNILCCFTRKYEVDRDLENVAYDNHRVHFYVPSDGYENSKRWSSRWDVESLQEAYERAVSRDFVKENDDRMFVRDYERSQFPLGMADMIDFLRTTSNGIDRVENIAKECRDTLAKFGGFSSETIEWRRKTNDYVPMLYDDVVSRVTHDGHAGTNLSRSESKKIKQCCEEIRLYNCELDHVRSDGSILINFGELKR